MAKKSSITCTCSKQASTCTIGNILIGLGFGALLANSLFSLHPIRWSVGLIVAGVVIHYYPKMVKK